MLFVKYTNGLYIPRPDICSAFCNTSFFPVVNAARNVANLLILIPTTFTFCLREPAFLSYDSLLVAYQSSMLNNYALTTLTKKS